MTSLLHTFILISVFLFPAFIIKAQVGIGTNTPVSSSILELKSENKGFLLPKINKVNNINDPVEGLLIYNTAKHCLSIYGKNGNGIAY